MIGVDLLLFFSLTRHKVLSAISCYYLLHAKISRFLRLFCNLSVSLCFAFFSSLLNSQTHTRRIKKNLLYYWIDANYCERVRTCQCDFFLTEQRIWRNFYRIRNFSRKNSYQRRLRPRPENFASLENESGTTQKALFILISWSKLRASLNSCKLFMITLSTLFVRDTFSHPK